MEIWKLILEPLTTFIVGGFAICIYQRQKGDQKRSAARLIIHEIRYAEQQIRNFKILGNYSFADKLLPTNSWNNNIHLFTGDLNEPEIDLISKFYANAAYIDSIVHKISNEANDVKLIKETQLQLSVNIPNDPPQIAQGQRGTVREVIPNSQNILMGVSLGIELIYNSPAIDKLRKISETIIFLKLKK